jgi:hypothetical protein
MKIKIAPKNIKICLKPGCTALIIESMWIVAVSFSEAQTAILEGQQG